MKPTLVESQRQRAALIIMLAFPHEQGQVESADTGSKDALGHVEREQEGNPTAMHRRGRMSFAYGLLCAVLSVLAGCATMRRNAPSADLAPVHRRLCVHRGWLEARRPALSAASTLTRASCR